MAENTKREDLRKIKIKQRQLSTKLKRVTSQDVSILDSLLFDGQLKLIDEACDEVTDAIDEMIEDFEESDDDHEEIISDLEKRKDEVIEKVMASRNEFISKKNKKVEPTIAFKVQEKNDGKNSIDDEIDTGEEPTNNDLPDIGSLDLKTVSTSKKNSAQKLGESIGKKAVKKVIKSEETASYAGEGLNELVTEEPGEVVLELVLGSIGTELGVTGTKGFLAAALTHYAICQFAVLVGVATTPVKMDFSGITQAKILKKLEDLNKKVDKIIKSSRVEALDYLKQGLLELQLKPIDFEEAKKKFEEVQKLARNAISLDDDFTNIAVCTKYLLFAETMVQSFNKEYTEGGKTHGACFLPIEKLSGPKRARMAKYLEKQIQELQSQMSTKGKKKEDHRDKVDDILKMVYNIISICKGLTNPNTPINNVVTFGIDTDYLPYGEEDATVLQVGRGNKESQCLNPEKLNEQEMKSIPGYIVYLWRDDKKVCVRRNLKVFEIPKQTVHGSFVWVQLKELDSGKITCMYGKDNESFERTSDSRNGYPKNIQKMKTLFDGAKAAKDMDSLPKIVYEMMQRISEVYLADLGIDINEKDKEGNTLLHYVACLKVGWSGKLTPIDCLVDAGADLSAQDNEGKTPLMAAMSHGSTPEKNIRKLIDLCEGTPALNAVDNEGNNVLHLAASKKESTFSKDIVKVLLKAKANANQVNNEDLNPRDAAHYHHNWKVHKILEDWLTGK